MLKAIINHGLLLLLLSTLLCLIGCRSPEEKRAQQLDTARELTAEGAYDEALEILEKLAVEYPNDGELLAAIGRIYAKSGDDTMAAFFLEQAHLQQPENVELLYETYQALRAADQPSGDSLAKLAGLSPESMTDELWIRLGAYRAQNNETESALRAYLRGADLEDRKPDSETAAAIGQLFARVGNLPQAENWLEVAADSDDPNALTALFGLLEIQLRQKRWADAESTIARLDKQFPGAVNASQWQQARLELERWRAAQEAMKAKLAEAEAKKKAEEEAAKKAAEAAEQTEATEQTVEVVEDGTSGENGAASAEAEGGKAQIVADLEAAEAMANQPAIEATGDEPDVDESAKNTIAFNPDIAIEPADPEFSFNVTFDQEALGAGTSYEVATTTQSPTVEASVSAASLPPAESPAPEENFAPPESPKTLEELLADAETAEIDRDYKSAIRKYWAAISIANNRADVWNLLSRAYLIDGQRKNAETAALEAIRLEPNEVAYTLDYLRVAQRTKPPEQFLSYLETAYDRFPASPEITLSLARAHERISQDRRTASNLYQRFIDIAPNHPLVPEARDAIARLR